MIVVHEGENHFQQSIGQSNFINARNKDIPIKYKPTGRQKLQVVLSKLKKGIHQNIEIFDAYWVVLLQVS